MSKHLYKQYAQLIAKWPRDPNKNPERDLAVFLKSELENQFKQDGSPLFKEPGLCEKRFKALEQIFSNQTASVYSQNYKSGIFGLNLEQLQEVSTDENRRHFGLVPKESSVRRIWRSIFPTKDASN